MVSISLSEVQIKVVAYCMKSLNGWTFLLEIVAFSTYVTVPGQMYEYGVQWEIKKKINFVKLRFIIFLIVATWF